MLRKYKQGIHKTYTSQLIPQYNAKTRLTEGLCIPLEETRVLKRLLASLSIRRQQAPRKDNKGEGEYEDHLQRKRSIPNTTFPQGPPQLSLHP